MKYKQIEMFIFYALFLMFASHFFTEKSFLVVVLDRLFSFGRQKNRSLVALNRWSPYTVTIVREFAWVDSALIILDEPLPYRGGRLNVFDCNALS